MPKDMTVTTDIFERRESAARSYCRGMPAVFACNVEDLRLENIAIERPEPLPPGFNPEAIVSV